MEPYYVQSCKALQCSDETCTRPLSPRQASLGTVLTFARPLVLQVGYVRMWRSNETDNPSLEPFTPSTSFDAHVSDLLARAPALRLQHAHPSQGWLLWCSSGHALEPTHNVGICPGPMGPSLRLWSCRSTLAAKRSILGTCSNCFCTSAGTTRAGQLCCVTHCL